MKILYICKYFIPKSVNSYGGRSYNLFLELSKIDGVSIDVVASNSLGHLGKLDLSSDIEKIDYNKNFSAFYLKTYSYKKSKSFDRILSWFDFERLVFKFFFNKARNYDIIYISSPSFLTLLTGYIFSKLFNKKLVLEIRDIWPLTLIEEGNKSKFNPIILLMGLLESFLYSSADLIIGTMPGLKKHVEKKTSSFFLTSQSNVVCIPFGVNESIRIETKKDSSINLNHYCSSSSALKIIYSGSIGISNALDNYFNLVSLLRDNINIHFFVLGDGPLRDMYVEKMINYENLTFIDSVNANEVNSIIIQGDILYLTNRPISLWSYGQSLNKLVDYMYSGKIILMEYTGLISMINDSKCGFVVDHYSSNHIIDIINFINKLGKNERLEIGNRGKDWILKNQSYEILAKKLYINLNKI